VTDGFRPELGPGGAWEDILGAPAPGQHVAQLYTDWEFLVRAVARYAGEGLRGDEAVLLVATALHGRAIMRCLEEEGLAPGHLGPHGQLVVLDAGETLRALLVDGQPDRSRFQAVIGGAVRSVAKAAGHRRVRTFGEVVDLLRGTSIAGALRLEALWGELLTAQGISLLCGYSIDAFDPQSYDGLLQRLISTHSHPSPVEDYGRRAEAVERSYAEVFGAGPDAAFLRRAFVTNCARSTAMPDAQAAILAACEFIPTQTADALLDRVRHHYHAGAPASGSGP
jgi:hypothetical protein